jgi:hypothetical protein
LRTARSLQSEPVCKMVIRISRPLASSFVTLIVPDAQ